MERTFEAWYAPVDYERENCLYAENYTGHSELFDELSNTYFKHRKSPSIKDELVKFKKGSITVSNARELIKLIPGYNNIESDFYFDLISTEEKQKITQTIIRSYDILIMLITDNIISLEIFENIKREVQVNRKRIIQEEINRNYEDMREFIEISEWRLPPDITGNEKMIRKIMYHSFDVKKYMDGVCCSKILQDFDNGELTIENGLSYHPYFKLIYGVEYEKILYKNLNDEIPELIATKENNNSLLPLKASLKVTSNPKIKNEIGTLDIKRLFNAMYEILVVDHQWINKVDGGFPTKKEFIQLMGSIFKDFKFTNQDLSQSFKADKEYNMQFFELLLKKQYTLYMDRLNNKEKTDKKLYQVNIDYMND